VKDPWGRGYPLGLRTQGRGFDSRWVRFINLFDFEDIDFTTDNAFWFHDSGIRVSGFAAITPVIIALF
jgi:hypothetical protein